MTSMRIVVTVPSLAAEFGGPTGKVFPLAQEVRDLGHDVRIVGVGQSRQAVGLPSLASFHGTPVPRSVRALERLIRRADVIHIIGFRDPVGSAAAIAATRAGFLSSLNRSACTDRGYDPPS